MVIDTSAPRVLLTGVTENWHDMASLTYPLMSDYAARCAAVFCPLIFAPAPTEKLWWTKFDMITAGLRAGYHVLWIDADVYVAPWACDVYTPDAIRCQYESMDILTAKLYRKRMKALNDAVKGTPAHWPFNGVQPYINAGLLSIPAYYQPFLVDPPSREACGRFGEQNWFNAVFWKHRLPLRPIPKGFRHVMGGDKSYKMEILSGLIKNPPPQE